MHYRVKKNFKYNGTILQPGEEWKPVGSKFDRLIAEQKMYVELVDERIPKRKYRVSKSDLAKEITVKPADKPKRKYTKRGKKVAHEKPSPDPD